MSLSNYYGNINGNIPCEIALPNGGNFDYFKDVCIFSGLMPIYKQCHCPVFTNPNTLQFEFFSECHYGGIHNKIEFNPDVAHFQFYKSALPFLSRLCNQIEDKIAVYKFVNITTDLYNNVTYNHERMKLLDKDEIVQLFTWCYSTQIINWFTRHVGERMLTFSVE